MKYTVRGGQYWVNVHLSPSWQSSRLVPVSPENTFRSSEFCKEFRMTSTRPLATALNIAARDFGSLLNASKAGQVSLGRSQRQQPHYLRGHDQGPLGEPVLGRSNDRQLDPNDGWALQKHWGGIPARPWDGGEGKLSRGSGAFILLVHCPTRLYVDMMLSPMVNTKIICVGNQLPLSPIKLQLSTRSVREEFKNPSHGIRLLRGSPPFSTIRSTKLGVNNSMLPPLTDGFRG